MPAEFVSISGSLVLQLNVRDERLRLAPGETEEADYRKLPEQPPQPGEVLLKLECRQNVYVCELRDQALRH